VVAIRLEAPATASAIGAVAIVFGLRITARRHDWKGPQPVDVPPEIRKRMESE